MRVPGSGRFWCAITMLSVSLPATAQVCISTSAGLNPVLRILFLAAIGVSALLLFKGKDIKASIVSSDRGRKLFNGVQGLVFALGLVALLHNTLLMQFFVINPNLHAEGSACARHNPGPCFGFLGDNYCLKKPSVSVEVSYGQD